MFKNTSSKADTPSNKHTSTSAENDFQTVLNLKPTPNMQIKRKLNDPTPKYAKLYMTESIDTSIYSLYTLLLGNNNNRFVTIDLSISSNIRLFTSLFKSIVPYMTQIQRDTKSMTKLIFPDILNDVIYFVIHFMS